jgi:rSAM/selenodomain-associated transferase 2
MNISVVIPAYNEANCISETIEKVRAHSTGEIGEIIVVDGGSTDETKILAKKAGEKIVQPSGKGRSVQMNYGAEQARGEILYFLHADSIPPEHFDRKIVQAVSMGYKAGCFRLAFDDDHWLLRCYGWFTRFDIDAFRFGDQSLFITRDVFNDVAGFREDHFVMEDNEMVRRIKGDYSFAILDDVVETSARAYREAGVLKLQLVFAVIYTLYFMGVAQETLLALKQSVIDTD